MFCPKCGKKCKVSFVQGDNRNRKLPLAYRGLNLLRRKQVCRPCNQSFWSIEATEEVWKVGTRTRESIEEVRAAFGNGHQNIEGSGRFETDRPDEDDRLQRS